MTPLKAAKLGCFSYQQLLPEAPLEPVNGLPAIQKESYGYRNIDI